MILVFPLLAPRFERMVAEVRLGKVGPVAAREVLRLARNSNDWQQPISHVGGLLSIINSTLAVERASCACNATTSRVMLDLRLAGVKSERAWLDAVLALVARDLSAPVLVVIDGNPGLAAALKER